MANTPRPRWFRFSLRMMLALVVVIAIPLAWVAKERRQSKYEQQVAEQLRDQGFKKITLGGPYDSWELGFSNNPQGRWRDLARQILGERIFRVDRIDIHLGGSGFAGGGVVLRSSDFNNLELLAGLTNLQGLDLDRTQVNDLTPLVGLPQLRWLNASYTQVSDVTPLFDLTNLKYLYLYETLVSDINPLSKLTNLQELGLNGTKVSDLTPLAGLKNLQSLYVDKTSVTDLAPLKSLTNLTKLSLSGSPVTKEQVDALQKALPNCKIKHDPFPVP
jgi:hypothetical protein